MIAGCLIVDNFDLRTWRVVRVKLNEGLALLVECPNAIEIETTFMPSETTFMPSETQWVVFDSIKDTLPSGFFLYGAK